MQFLRMKESLLFTVCFQIVKAAPLISNRLSNYHRQRNLKNKVKVLALAEESKTNASRCDQRKPRERREALLRLRYLTWPHPAEGGVKNVRKSV